MIHTVWVDQNTEVPALLKSVRRSLMTGGAVVRIAPDLTPADLELIRERFNPLATKYNIAGAVMRELSRYGQPL